MQMLVQASKPPPLMTGAFSMPCDAAGLAPLLQNNSTALTVFAPSNGAWVHLPPGLVLNDSRALGNIMLYHIALGGCPGFSFQSFLMLCMSMLC